MEAAEDSEVGRTPPWAPGPEAVAGTVAAAEESHCLEEEEQTFPVCPGALEGYREVHRSSPSFVVVSRSRTDGGKGANFS